MSEFLDDSFFSKFRDLIYSQSGIHFSETNRSILESRLKERLRKADLSGLNEYYNLILRDTEEMKILLDSVTTNLTRFFRNTAHFQTLEYYVLPDLVAYKTARKQKKITVWSAGCSTGEEPYSIAILFHDLLPADIKIEIIASDLSLKSLMTAKEGFYPESRINGVPTNYLKKYFTRMDGGYRIIEPIRNIVRFDYHNLKNDSSLTDLDIIICRNVIIYFDETAQESVINRFWKAMSGHSYLFIGHSESLFGMNTQFEFLKTDWACIYRKFME